MRQFVADVDLNFVFPRGNIEVCLERGVALPAGTPFTIPDEAVAAFEDFGTTRIEGFRWLTAEEIAYNEFAAEQGAIATAAFAEGSEGAPASEAPQAPVEAIAIGETIERPEAADIVGEAAAEAVIAEVGADPIVTGAA